MLNLSVLYSLLSFLLLKCRVLTSGAKEEMSPPLPSFTVNTCMYTPIVAGLKCQAASE